jgi:anti-sigma factor RsiW
MKNCEDIAESLGVWLDGELSLADAEVIRLHLEGCALCEGKRRQLENLNSSLKSLLDASLPRVALEPFWRGVQERIAAKRTWRQQVMESIRSGLTGPAGAWAVPAAIVIVLAVLSVDALRKFATQRNNFAAVESIDAYGRNVALWREDETKTTVIWLYHNQEGEDESSGENTETGPSF